MSAQIAQPMHSPTSRRQRIAAPALNLSRGLEERRMSHDQYRRKETIQMVSALQVRCPDIECEGCANAIKRSLGSVAGVRDIQVGVESKSVTVQFDPARVSEGALRERLSRAGFRPA
jgi:copper chaperone CopZ